ncbi:MAG TPA: carbohydrate ABC transporter permease [Clostridiales bacterium]|nr:carbohydrate ABC transporter permease [Clostridiales bacterium]
MKKILSKFLLYIILIAISLIVFIPLYWMLISSLKENIDVFSIPIIWWPKKLIWNNYAEVFKVMPFITNILNSFKLVVIITIVQLFTSSFAAYGFSKIEFPGRDLLFVGYIFTLAIPWQSYMIPQFMIMRTFKLIDKHLALVLLLSFTALGVFLIKQFYASIPYELNEAARIDGLSEYGIYAKIILPLSKPAIAALTISTFVNVWNDYMGAIIYLNSDNKKTIQLALRELITSYGPEYSLIMAGSVISLIPVLILFLFLQRYFVAGISMSGLKG